MKILVLSNLYPPEVIGGYEIQCSQATDELRRRGHQVLVLTSIPRRPVAGQAHVLRRFHQPDVYSPQRSRLRSPFWEFESNLLCADNVHALIEVLEQFQPDVCYLWNLVAIGGAGLVATLEYLGVPWVWHLGDATPALLCNFNGELVEMGRAMGARLTGRYLACSQTVVNKVERLVRITDNVRIVPNWVTLADGSGERGYFSGDRPLRMIHAGRLAEEKGVFIVLDAVALLRDQGCTGFSLDLFGSGDVELIQKEIDARNLQDYVTLGGWLTQERFRVLLRNYDLFLFPTFRWDGMPLAPLEAAAEGCVPVLPVMSGVSEWLVDGVHCIKAERTPAAFATALRRVADHEIALEPIARRAMAVTHEDFSLESIIPIVEAELTMAANRSRDAIGDAASAYRLARMGEAMLRREALSEDRPPSDLDPQEPK